jgi:hypothetical protein
MGPVVVMVVRLVAEVGGVRAEVVAVVAILGDVLVVDVDVVLMVGFRVGTAYFAQIRPASSDRRRTAGGDGEMASSPGRDASQSRQPKPPRGRATPDGWNRYPTDVAH